MRLQVGADPDAIERQIVETRERVDRTLHALKDRLSPQQIVRRSLDTARDRARGAAQDLAHHLRHHPLPWTLAVLSVGLIWLVKAKASRRTGEMPRAAVGRSDSRRRGAALHRLGDALYERPALLSAMGLVLGVLIGGSLPDPGPTERQWGRRARNQLVARSGPAMRLFSAALRAAESIRH